jgi:hypothetical protein
VLQAIAAWRLSHQLTEEDFRPYSKPHAGWDIRSYI